MAEDGFRFAPLREEQLPMLADWLARAHVAAWWQPTPSIAQLRQDYLVDGARDKVRAFIASSHGRPVGFVQCYVVMGAGGGWWPHETDPGARGIDQFLADASDLGRGLGSAMVRAFVEDVLFADGSVTVVQADPHPDNERGVRCYARAGFERVGIVDTPDGPALLMRCSRGPHSRQERNTT